jgi:hypothetical protein
MSLDNIITSTVTQVTAAGGVGIALDTIFPDPQPVSSVGGALMTTIEIAGQLGSQVIILEMIRNWLGNSLDEGMIRMMPFMSTMMGAQPNLMRKCEYMKSFMKSYFASIKILDSPPTPVTTNANKADTITAPVHQNSDGPTAAMDVYQG